MNAVEAFAGAGGAALGLAQAGFRALTLLEWDHAACETLRAADYGPVVEGDVRKWLPSKGLPRVDLLWSSPPCQAWSMAGSRKGARDERNGWPWHWALVDRLTVAGRKPTWILAENVKGMLIHASKANCAHGKHPNPMDCPACYWHEVVVPEALARYAYVGFRVLDAADYGVPQRRHRVILACGPHEYAWSEPTHSQEALIHAKWVSGTYWEEHGIEPVGAPSREEERLLKRGLDAGKLRLARWNTIRDALGLFAWAEYTRGSGITERHGARRGVPADEAAPAMQAGSNGSGPRQRLTWNWPIRHQSPTADTIQRSPVCCTRRPCRSRATRTPGSAGGCWVGRSSASRRRAVESTQTCRSTGRPAPSVAEVTGTRPSGYYLKHDLRHYADNSPMDTRHLDTPAPTVTGTEVKGTRAGPASGYTMSGGPDRASDAAWLATGRRRLEPAECAALQSFPPGYPFKGTKTAQYTQVGNAVPPPLAYALANAILPD